MNKSRKNKLDKLKKVEKIKKIRIKNRKMKWPQIAHHSSRIRAHRVHHRPFNDYENIKNKIKINKKIKKIKSKFEIIRTLLHHCHLIDLLYFYLKSC